ncbi:vWA domain-containing protein [Ornithinibacillus contaminans]|uniref:vWA domain-containing protein n=1 Tax=Ornithinibacillus contaminans TaxID=694055 RepID=UPI00064E0CBE|nr:VWA domain-containing protein [Ornithinibacillus contaminans]
MFLKKHEQIYKNNTINADGFDKRRFNELLKISKGLQELKGNGEQIFPAYSQLMGDIWSSLYKTKPHLLSEDEISKELLPNHTYMQQVMEDEAFESNRDVTKLDNLSSALSTVSFSNKVLEWIQQARDQNEEFDNAVNEALKELSKKQEKEKNGKQPTKKQQELLEQKMNGLAEQLNNQLNNASNQFGEMMKEAVKEAKSDKDNMKQLIGGISAGDGESEMEKIPLRDKFALAEALQKTKKMKGISDWAGRFKQIARTKQKSLHKEAFERNGIALGNEIERLLPSELVNLAIPQAKMDFMRKFSEGQAMQYDKKGKEALGKGPIILCLDESQSMRDLEEQSKGFALALMSIAKKQKRDFALISFSNSAYVKEFPKGKSKINDLIVLAENFLGGGTNFYDPLKKSLKLINKSRFKNADIVFVTDGEANLGDDFIVKFNQDKKQNDFQCLSVIIGKGVREDTVSRFSDKIVKAKDFTEANEVFEI